MLFIFLCLYCVRSSAISCNSIFVILLSDQYHFISPIIDFSLMHQQRDSEGEFYSMWILIIHEALFKITNVGKLWCVIFPFSSIWKSVLANK